MPIYEFECPSCGERFDRLQKLSDPDPDSCPNCGASGVRRRLTAPAFRLAGSGWYETDFKKDGDKKRNLAEKSGNAAGEGKSAEAKGSADDGKSAQAKSAEGNKATAPSAKSEAAGSTGKSKPAEAAKTAAPAKAPGKSDAS